MKDINIKNTKEQLMPKTVYMSEKTKTEWDRLLLTIKAETRENISTIGDRLIKEYVNAVFAKRET
jgi:hypothetical protein